MPGTSLIDGYLAALSADLPQPIVEELADGLEETCRRYIGQGLDPDAAARAAVAEFGEPRVIVAAFTRASRGRSTARRLLAAGPVVAVCWAIVLITARAWQWPVPVAGRVLFGVTLITVIGLLATAAVGRRYRSVCRTAAAGCVGIAILDVVMIGTVLIIAPVLVWPVVLAVAVSAGRSVFALQNVRHALTG
jgi:fatty acid desaturase